MTDLKNQFQKLGSMKLVTALYYRKIWITLFIKLLWWIPHCLLWVDFHLTANTSASNLEPKCIAYSLLWRTQSYYNSKAFFFFLIFVVIQLDLSVFSPHPYTPPQQNTPPSPAFTLLLDLILYSSSYKPILPVTPTHSPLAIVRLFLTSMSLVIFCLLFSSVDYVPVKGDIIWYLSLTAWLISFSKMLSISIYAVAKGISSFFLSAAKNSIV